MSSWISTDLKRDGLFWRWSIETGGVTAEGVRFLKSHAAADQAALLGEMLKVQRTDK